MPYGPTSKPTSDSMRRLDSVVPVHALVPDFTSMGHGAISIAALQR